MGFGFMYEREVKFQILLGNQFLAHWWVNSRAQQDKSLVIPSYKILHIGIFLLLGNEFHQKNNNNNNNKSVGSFWFNS